MPNLGIIASSTRQGQNLDTGAIVPIQSFVIGSAGASSITFSNIPTTGYAHLQIRCSTLLSASSNTQMRFNSDSTGNYTYHALKGDGSAPGTNYGTSLGAFYLGGSGSGSTSPVAMIVDILDYASVNKNKTIRSFFGADGNGNGTVGLISGAWLNSSTAVSTISLFQDSGQFNQYTSFALYGIKAAS